MWRRLWISLALTALCACNEGTIELMPDGGDSGNLYTQPGTTNPSVNNPPEPSVIVDAPWIFDPIRGAPLWVTAIADDDATALELVILANPVETADERPAILLVAGLDGGHALGPKLLGAIEQDILANHADVLDETTFYILPRMNPDAFAANGGESAFVRRGSSRRIDEDRDGLVDEDPPRDLDGNGVITLMRWKDETLKRPLTHLPDPADTRMMKSPDTGKGESATHVVAIEGIACCLACVWFLPALRRSSIEVENA